MKTFLLVAALVAATSLLPVAAAEPECLQVYPWSELCQGDVHGFLCAMGACFELACDGLRDCLAILDQPCVGGPPCPPDPTGGWS